jgi:hypothetical protein
MIAIEEEQLVFIWVCKEYSQNIMHVTLKKWVINKVVQKKTMMNIF